METRVCQNCKKNFVIEPEDFVFYEKIKVPPPTFCPECRMIRRFNYRNEGMLFRRKDGYTGEEIFSGYNEEAKVKTYENDFWFGNNWNPLDTGRDYDFDRNFFEQFEELLKVAPIPARSVYNMINSDYCNEASETKNSYLCFNTDYLENCGYIRKVRRAIDSFDCYEVAENEVCYENVLVDKCYKTLFSTDCESCADVWFSKNLRGCTNCFGCVNLRNKSNCYFNKQLSKEEYQEKVKSFSSGSYSDLIEMKKIVYEFWKKFPNKFYHGIRVVDSTGERIFDSKSVKDCYYVKDAENIRYCQDIWQSTSSCYDYSVWGDGAENIYECMTCGLGIYNLKFCFNCWENAKDLEYCVYSMGSKNCFGCVGLLKQEYCILNKQYSKDEYFLMVEKIKKQMDEIPYADKKGRIYKYGEFFPFEISPTAYNESLAQDFFPLNKKETEERGYNWRIQKKREYMATIIPEDLPDDIVDVKDSIVDEILECCDCNRAYRIIQIELDFYRKMKLPIPRFCHECRFKERFKLVNHPKLWERECMCEIESHEHSKKCNITFQTSYDPKSDDIIYCENCYNKEVN